MEEYVIVDCWDPSQTLNGEVYFLKEPAQKDLDDHIEKFPCDKNRYQVTLRSNIDAKI